MSKKKKNLSEIGLSGEKNAEGLTFGIVVSEWNTEITQTLLDGCQSTLLGQGADASDIQVIYVPGAFELPTGARMLDDKHNLDAVICLGCVIEGETKHNEYINHAVATGITQLGVLRSKPFIFGVLTPSSMEQAKDRAGGIHGNKGVEAAATAIKMALIKKELKSAKKKIGF